MSICARAILGYKLKFDLEPCRAMVSQCNYTFHLVSRQKNGTDQTLINNAICIINCELLGYVF